MTNQKSANITIADRLRAGGKREDPESCSFLIPDQTIYTCLKYKNLRFFTFLINVPTYEQSGKYRVKSKKWESPEVALIF